MTSHGRVFHVQYGSLSERDIKRTYGCRSFPRHGGALSCHQGGTDQCQRGEGRGSRGLRSELDDSDSRSEKKSSSIRGSSETLPGLVEPDLDTPRTAFARGSDPATARIPFAMYSTIADGRDSLEASVRAFTSTYLPPWGTGRTRRRLGRGDACPCHRRQSLLATKREGT